MTTLIACSHGTDSPEGRASIDALIDLVRDRLPRVRVVPAYVDVQQPHVSEVVGREQRDDDVVVVPLLLSAGYHTAVDIAEAVAAHPRARQADPLGTHPAIAAVLATRLRAAIGSSWRPGDHVVLGAAGSSNPLAVRDVETAAHQLAALIPAPVTVGYAAASTPRIADAVRTAREAGAERVIAASHVLAPGYFAGVVRAAGADVTSAPLGVDERIASIVAERFRAA